MTARSERDVIIDHALRDEDHLEIALKIGQAYSDLCSRVIVGFLAAVEAELSPRLKSAWKVTVPSDSAHIATQHCLNAHFPGHPGGFHVLLSADEPKYPFAMYFAVRSDPSVAVELTEHVRDTVNAAYLKGHRGDPSFWYKYVDKAYTSWGSADATLLLYRKGEALTYFVDHLEKLAQAVERALP
jgi:hypothetical protein